MAEGVEGSDQILAPVASANDCDFHGSRGGVRP
jgi:hypothetical protein